MSVAVGGQVFKMHSCVMRVGCDYFRGLLENARLDNGRFVFVLRKCDQNPVGPQAFRAALDYIYTDKPTMHAPDLFALGQYGDDIYVWKPYAVVVDVLKTADFLLIEPMVNAYTQLLQHILTPETVVDVLELLENIPGLHQAREVATEYFVKNAGAVQVREL